MSLFTHFRIAHFKVYRLQRDRSTTAKFVIANRGLVMHGVCIAFCLAHSRLIDRRINWLVSKNSIFSSFSIRKVLSLFSFLQVPHFKIVGPSLTVKLWLFSFDLSKIEYNYIIIVHRWSGITGSLLPIWWYSISLTHQTQAVLSDGQLTKI